MDPYVILGISRNASAEDIKKAYLRLAHIYHPDKAGGDAEKFKKISAAYAMLKDKVPSLQQGGYNPPPAESGRTVKDNFDDAVSDLFRQAFPNIQRMYQRNGRWYFEMNNP